MKKNNSTDKVPSAEVQHDSYTFVDRLNHFFISFSHILLYCCLGIILLCLAGMGYLNLRYSDDNIKKLIIAEFSKNTQADISIGDLDIAWLSQTINIKNVGITATSNTDTPIVTIDNLTFNFDLVQSFKENSLYGHLKINGFKFNIHRFRILDSNTKREKYTTNITESLNNLIDLPWKKWLGDINWRRAGGSIEFTGGAIQITDDLNLLENCLINDIEFQLSRNNADIRHKLVFKSLTHKELIGTASIVCDALLSSQADNENDSKLDFLDQLNIDANLVNIDVAEYAAYFGVEKFKFGKAALIFKDPVSVKLSVDSNTMKDVTVLSQIRTDSLGSLELENEHLGLTPRLLLDLAGKLDFSSNWTEIKPLKADLSLFDAKGKLLAATANVNGNFGNEIVATIDAISDLTLFSSSEIGHRLGSTVTGRLNHTFALNWKRNGIWKANYNLKGIDVSTIINKQRVTVPVSGDVSCIITKSLILTPLEGNFNFLLKLPFLDLQSVKPVNVSFQKSEKISDTDIKFNLYLGKFYDTFEELMKSLKIGRIPEIIAGDLNADKSGTVSCNLSSTSTLADYASSPIKLSAVLKPVASESYDFKVDAGGGTELQVEFSGNISKNNNDWTAQLAHTGVIQAKLIRDLEKRFEIVLSGAALPFNFTGLLREAVNANIKYSAADHFTVAAGIKAQISEFSTVLRQIEIERKELNLQTSLVFNQDNGTRTVAINSLNFTTPDSFLDLSAADYNLSSINPESWKASIEALPAIKGKLSVSKSDMSLIGRITGNDIADLYFREATVSGLFASSGGGKSHIQNFKYTSIPLTVLAHKDFDIDPVFMTEKIINHEWFAIQRSLSDVSAYVSADLNNWKLFLPQVAVKTIAPFEFNADYFQSSDKLEVHDFNTLPTSAKDLLLPKLRFKGSVVNFFSNLEHFDLKQFLLAIDDHLVIEFADISVPKLKLLAGSTPGSNVRALRGKAITLSNIIVNHKLGDNFIELAGSAAAKLSYMSKSSRWPLMELAGSLSNYKAPLLLQFTDAGIVSKGSIDLTAADITFNALSPYHYYKALKQPLKLDYNAGLNFDGSAAVSGASLVGGPLSVELNNMIFKPVRDRFALTVDSIKLDGPFSINMDKLSLDSYKDQVLADISIAPVDLSKLQNSLNLSVPLQLSGSINGVQAHIDDGYWKYFAPVNTVVKQTRLPNNHATIGATAVTLSALENTDKSVSFAFAKGVADASINSLKLENLTVDNPQGFSNTKAVEAEAVRIEPDFQTLFSDQIIINRIDVDKLNAYYEVAFTTNNFDVLKDNLNSIFSGNVTNSSSSHTRKTLIKDLYVNNGMVRLSTKLLLGVASIPVPLNLHLENIGGDSPGQTFVSSVGSIFSSIGKLGVGLVGGVGGVIGEVGKVGKSILKAPLKLFGKDDNTKDEE